MDKEFQTSFIPKKTVVEKPARKRRAPGFFNLIAFLLLAASLVSAIGVFAYKSSLEKKVSEMKNSLDLARQSFEPGLISELEELDVKLQAATSILDSHIAVSPIFEVLEETTRPFVRFKEFNFENMEGSNNKLTVLMSGEARSYEELSRQADLFDTNPFINNPIFSDFSLDEFGNVEFSVSFSVDNNLISFESVINRALSQ